MFPSGRNRLAALLNNRLIAINVFRKVRKQPDAAFNFHRISSDFKLISAAFICIFLLFYWDGIDLCGTRLLTDATCSTTNSRIKQKKKKNGRTDGRTDGRTEEMMIPRECLLLTGPIETCKRLRGRLVNPKKKSKKIQ